MYTAKSGNENYSEEIKYHAARYVFKIRNTLTPSRKITWRRWWELKFKDDYVDYIKTMERKKDG